MKIGGAFGEGYNAQASCSGESGIVIAAMVGNNVDDKENLFKMESQIRSFVPECSQEQLSNSKYLFDNGYYSTDNVLKAIEKGIDIYIPDTQDSKYYSRKSHGPRGSVGIADCTIDYDEQGLFVTCPGGRILRDWKIKRNNGKESYRFPVLSPAKCEGCIYHSICIGKQTKNWKDFTILKSKLDERKILSNYETKIRSEKGKRIYSNRMPLIERGFGYVKENIGFRRFLRRGLEKVTNEWFIICSAYNLTRMFNLAYP
jgi:transposase